MLPRRRIPRVDRRAFLRSASRCLIGAALVSSWKLDALATQAPPLRVLSRDQYRVIAAAADRIWPGARETGVVTYIGRALKGAYAADIRTYRIGAARLDTAAQSSFGRNFSILRGEEQDQLLTALEAGTLSAMPGVRGAQFFATLRRHVMEGVLSDPVYGGNRDFAGWRAVGYPGPRRHFTASEQTSIAPLDLPYQSIADLR